MKLVYIKWHDSAGQVGGWCFEDEVDFRHHVIDSIGWAVKEDEKQILIAPHITDIDKRDRQFQGYIIVPKIAILEMKEVKLEYTKKEERTNVLGPVTKKGKKKCIKLKN